MTLTLRYMTVADISAAIVIDRIAFDLPWSENAYQYEVTRARHSHMVTLEWTQPAASNGWLGRLLHRNGKNGVQRIVVGYGGLWNIVDEAHISTIAIHPDWRGRGWGEILLAGMVRRAMTLKAGYVVLEVRVSNTVAKNLYDKYHFETVGVKERYYRNNNEDAYNMHLHHIHDPAVVERFDALYSNLQARHNFIDLYSAVEPPVKLPDDSYY